MFKVSLALEPPVAISTARIGEGLLSLRFPRTRLHAASAPVGVQARLGSVRSYTPAMAMATVLPRTYIHAATAAVTYIHATTSHAVIFVTDCLLHRPAVCVPPPRVAVRRECARYVQVCSTQLL